MTVETTRLISWGGLKLRTAWGYTNGSRLRFLGAGFGVLLVSLALKALNPLTNPYCVLS